MIPRSWLKILALAHSLLDTTLAAPLLKDDPVQLMNYGIGRLEEYSYLEAYGIFDRLATAYPGWEAAHANRGMAALNVQKDEKEGVDYLPIAEKAFSRALEINPRCVQALVGRGILYYHTGRIDLMLEDYVAAAAIEPDDPHILCQKAVALIEKGRTEEALVAFERVLKLQPSFSTAMYRLRELFARKRQLDRMKDVLRRFAKLETTESGIKTGVKYGECGKYSFALAGTVPPGWKAAAPQWRPAPAPSFSTPVKITQKPALKRIGPNGKSRAPAFAVGDLDRDGGLELVFCGEKDENDAGSVTLYGLDDSGAWGLRERFPFADAEVCAMGDLDLDFDSDIVLAGPGWLKLLENDGGGKLSVRELDVKGTDFAGLPMRLTLVDADSDGDLDIVSLRVERQAEKWRSRVEILSNDRKGKFQEIAARASVGPFDFPAAELVVADLDSDVDLDLLVFDGSTGVVRTFANDRAWDYHEVNRGPNAPSAPGLVSTTGGDFDGDGDEDLVLFCGDSLRFWRNVGGLVLEEEGEFTRRFGALGGNAGVLADFRGAFETSLLALGTGGGRESAAFLASPTAEKAVQLEWTGKGAPADRSALVTVIREGRAPELVVYDTVEGGHSLALPSAQGWFVLQLEGSKRWTSKKERSNFDGIGASVEIRKGTKALRYWLHGGAGGAGRQSVRGFCGLEGDTSADFVRIIWPDGVLQAEKGLTRGRVNVVQEIERKPTSCPILFAWTESGFEFVADFLGVGGLGYLESYRVYSKPDPSEYVLLPDLGAEDGFYKLDILEPLEECTYLDELKLTVVEHPSEVNVIPDEMYAIRGPQPGYKLLSFRERNFPVRASNDAGNDVTQELREADRRYGNQVQPDPAFLGLCLRTHAIELDFENRIRDMLEGNPGAKPCLFLYGFVKYGYSTTNFAAWQASAAPSAPSVGVEREGKWVTLREEWGFPAGYPRYMSIDLSGLLGRGDRRLRVDTNLEIYWDQAFLADVSVADFTVVELSWDAAELAFRGFPREVSPDGALPGIYLHGEFEPEAQMKAFPGRYTRHGDVRGLLQSADDRLAILGPGDGLELKVRADRLLPLSSGRRRTFLLKAFGYCKDMDLYTAHPERIEPLPFKAMSGYPFRPEEAAASRAAHADYTNEWNTREVK